MDYEKAYKKAIEQARKELKTCGSMDCDAARQIFRFFPELRESEDERNIDTIFNCLYQCCDTGFISGTQRDNALAYLEKQKEQYNKLGRLASLGCVRLPCNDAKWIYDNCPIGTQVVIYSDSSSAGPMGQPTPLRLDVNDIFMRGWDPTDPDRYNQN